MNLPEIAIYNLSNQSDSDVRHAVRAVNRQITEDFKPLWGAAYFCSVRPSSFAGGSGEEVAVEPVTANAAIYLLDTSHAEGAAAYHFRNGGEIPSRFVFTDAGPWTVSLSNAVLQLIVDPSSNLFAPGPDPRPGRRGMVLRSYEACAPVERTVYRIDGVSVSNFVTPTYFSPRGGAGIRTDFLGTPLTAFGVLPGCHIGFVDTDAGEFVVYVQGGAFENARKSADPELVEADRGVGKRAIEASIAKAKNEDMRRVLVRSHSETAYREAAGGLRKQELEVIV